MMGLMCSVVRSAQAAVRNVAKISTTKALHRDQCTTGLWSLNTKTHTHTHRVTSRRKQRHLNANVNLSARIRDELKCDLSQVQFYP